MSRPGFGEEHPGVAPLVAPLTPVVTTHHNWNGLVIEGDAYLTGPIELPPVVTCAARAVVLAASSVLVCETPRDMHILPGGQLEPGETLLEAACREVLEETGWRIKPANTAMLGFIHHRNVSPVPADHRFPNPDFIHAVFVVHAHASDAPEGDWADTAGWVRRSRLLPVDDAMVLIDEGQQAFLRAALRSVAEPR